MKNEAVHRERKWGQREQKRNDNRIDAWTTGAKPVKPISNQDRALRGRTIDFIIFDELSGEEERTTGVAPGNLSPRQLKKARMRVMKAQTAQREALIEHHRKLQAELDEQRMALNFGDWG